MTKITLETDREDLIHAIKHYGFAMNSIGAIEMSPEKFGQYLETLANDLLDGLKAAETEHIEEERGEPYTLKPQEVPNVGYIVRHTRSKSIYLNKIHAYLDHAREARNQISPELRDNWEIISLTPFERH